MGLGVLAEHALAAALCDASEGLRGLAGEFVKMQVVPRVAHVQLGLLCFERANPVIKVAGITQEWLFWSTVFQVPFPRHVGHVLMSVGFAAAMASLTSTAVARHCWVQKESWCLIRGGVEYFDNLALADRG